MEQPKQPPPAVLPEPQPVQMETVRWQVVEAEGEPLFALTPNAYESLSRNLADLVRWVTEASYQIKFYREQRLSVGDKSTTTVGTK